MRFAFTDDQLLFRDTVADLLQKECPPERVRDAWASDDGRLPAVWSALAEMGIVGLTVPEAQGGLGMDELDLVLLLEQTGRAALPEPIVETTAVAAPLLASIAVGADPELAARAKGWLGRIAAGDLTVAVSLHGGPFMANVDTAGLMLYMDGTDLVAVEDPASDPSVRLGREPSVDGSRRLFTVQRSTADSGTDIVLATGVDADALASTAFDRGALGTAAQLLGLADHLLATTVDYVKEREQFGVPIGSFQAIKHHLADALLTLEFARPVVYRAAYSMARGVPESSRDVSMAKCYASDAALLVARQALQCHGAIGYTVEYDLHLWLKRVWALAASWGDAAQHRGLVADAVLGAR